MSDGYVTNLGSGGNTFASDDIAGTHYPIGKLAYGALDSATLVTTSAGLPVQQQSGATFTVVGTGTLAVQVDGAALTALQLIDDVVYAEDVAHVSGNKGVFVLAVRNAGLSALTSDDGDYSPIAVDGAGQVAVTTLDSGGLFVRPALGGFAVTVTAVVPGNGATQLGKAVDAIAGATDTGVAALTVRDDTLAALSEADGDYSRLRVDATGRLWCNVSNTVVVSGVVDASGSTVSVSGAVDATQSGTWSVRAQDGSGNALTSATRGSERALSVQVVDSSGNQISSFGGSGGTAMADDAAFTAATTSFTPVGGIVTADSVDSGDGGAFAMLANRQQKVTLYDSSGVEVSVGGGTQYTEDAASAGAEKLTLAGAVRRDTAASSSGTDGDYSTLNTDATGRLWCHVGTVDGGTITTITNAVTVAQATAANLNATVVGTGTFQVQVSSLPASTNTIEVVGDAAHDAAAAGNPVLAGGYASAAAPTDVSADGDAVRAWHLRNGAAAVQPTFAGVLGVAGNGASGTGVQRVTIANDSTGVLATVSTVTTLTTLANGQTAHDAASSGNPLRVGAKAETALSGITLVADGDATDLYAGVDGVLIVRPHANLEDVVSGLAAITDGSSTSVIAAQGAGVKVYVTSVIIANSSASNVTVDLRDGTAGSVKATFPAPANGGVVHPLPVPLPFSANTAVAADPSAAASTVTVTLVGFKSKV